MDPLSVKTLQMELPLRDMDAGTYVEGIRAEIFAMELQTRVFTGKGLEIHTVRFNNVLSFSCICLKCERGFSTQSLLELHTRTHLQNKDTVTHSVTSLSVTKIEAEDDSESDNNIDNDCSSKDTDQPMDDKADAKSTDTDQPMGDKADVKRSDTDQPMGEKADVKSIDTEQPLGDKADVKRSDTDQPLNDKTDVESSDCSESEASSDSLDAVLQHAVLDIPENAEYPFQSTLGGASTDISEQTEAEGNSEVSKVAEEDTHELIAISLPAENANLFKCNFCGRVLSRKQTFIQHMNRHAQGMSTVCRQRYTMNPQRRIPKGKRKGQKLHSCEVCGKRFTSKCYLKRHSSVHTEEKPHSCDVCGKQFRLRTQVTEHKKVHKEEKPHTCCTCGKTFSRPYYLNRHALVHGENTILCYICGKTFKHRSSLYTHIKTHTAGKQKPFFCSECGKTFCQRFYLEEHVRIHTGERPIKCPHCDLTFRMRESLRIHLRRQHQGSKQTTSSSNVNRTSSSMTDELEHVSEDV